MRAILHVDMDAFFASVEIRDNPALVGKPVVVGGDGRRGVVAAASYAVRAYGVRSAMPIREARQRCPELIVVRPRMDCYKAASRQVFKVFHEVTPLVEGLSLDEAFLDVTDSRSLFGDEITIARFLKQRIFDSTGLTASVGVASNKLVAKIASDLNKPDGLTVVQASDICAVLDPLPAGKLWGVGPKTLQKVHAAGLHTFRDLRLASDSQLQALFGRSAAQLRARAAGEDTRPVVPEWQELQISAEETFDHDLKDPTALLAAMTALSDRACSRLRAKGWKAGTVTVKLRQADFQTFTRQRALTPPTSDTQCVLQQACALFDHWHREAGHPAVRLLGVGLGSLAPDQQLDLFATASHQDLKSSEPARDSTDHVVDAIRAKFGQAAVRRGNTLDRATERADGFTDLRRKN